MKTEYIFYVLGIIFLFATVAYFSYQYVFGLSDTIKSIILFLLVIVSFFIGTSLQERDV
jgi:hypothetical protein